MIQGRGSEIKFYRFAPMPFKNIPLISGFLLASQSLTYNLYQLALMKRLIFKILFPLFFETQKKLTKKTER